MIEKRQGTGQVDLSSRKLACASGSERCSHVVPATHVRAVGEAPGLLVMSSFLADPSHPQGSLPFFSFPVSCFGGWH